MSSAAIGEALDGYPSASDVRSPHFDFDRMKGVEILLDGEPVKQCIAYDVGAGWVDRYVVDDEGRSTVKEGRLAQERVHGRVDVRRGSKTPA